MVTKKVRTEYMKKFRDPKWETFSKCYEDSLKYRLTRRVMEHSHKPWFWEGWDTCSDSSGWSTPRLTRNKIAPLSLPPPPTTSEVKQRLLELKTSPLPKASSEDREPEVETGDAPVLHAAEATEAAVENGVNGASGGSATAAPNTSGPSDDTATDNGPADSTSSNGEPPDPAPRRRLRRRTQRSEPPQRDGSHDDKPAVVQKPQRAKSQPPISSREVIRRSSSRLDWTERKMETSQTFDACLQTRRESDKRRSNLERRRARSADLEKLRQTQLTVVDDRWMTEYMRCFSARIR